MKRTINLEIARTTYNAYYLTDTQPQVIVCSSGLHEYWDFPKGTSELTLVLSDTNDDPNSYFVRIRSLRRHEIDVTLSDGRRQKELLFFAAVSFLHRHFPNGCYLTLF